ncbi:N-acetylmuramoyl-L-alanine amidase [Paenibacillus doosanensis]|uniref:N-acetylmuramoyl-L-alanine amidase n=1 Tax=Paenibacillus doosanensis TaxID=1229154 RepID=UPI00217F5B19|nr:N-acetylmuramoyl-L-alanine amidase [Paenibacillus doosanensis]MCS7462518.1 N-acetylmuramoyl-L-alanine amidase [Paenibacillus doosanensis]
MRVATTLLSLLLFSLLLCPMMAFAAVQPIQLFLNGKPLVAEVPPRIIKDNTVVPVRIIAESLGSKVKWDEKSRKVTIDKSGVSIQLFIDKQSALVNNESFELETAPTIVDGNTLLPLRFVSEQFGVDVTWDDLTRSVFLYQSEGDVKEAVSSPAAGADGKPAAGEEAGAKPGKDEGAATAGKDEGKTDGRTESKPQDNAGDKQQDKPGEKQQNAAGDKQQDKPEPDKTGGSAAAADAGKNNAAGTAADKPGSVNPSGQPGSPAEGKDGGKDQNKDQAKEPLTTIRSIALEGDQFVIKTSGADQAANVSAVNSQNRIVIDIPYGQLDPTLKLNDKGEGTIKVNRAGVSQIRYLLFSKESSIVRIIIDLTNRVDFKPSVKKVPNQLSWTISAAKDKYKVVIDPGHGGKDSGAISATKRMEKDFVLSLGLKVNKLLQKEPKIEPYMTRGDDTFVELADRASFANNMNADLFVSIHANSAGKESVEGVETYYYTDQSLPFAKLMHEQLLKSTQFPDRKVKQENFYVVKNTTMPSLLLEIGFLTNKSEEAVMYQDAFQDRVAASIVAAIKQQLNID